MPHRLDYPDVPAWWLLEQNLPRFADRVAIRELHHETGSVGRVLTYAQLWRAVCSAARGLQEHGVAPGVHVGFCLPNSSALIIGYYATWCAGGTVVPANPAARDSEVTEQFTDARVELIVGVPGGPGQAAAVRLGVPPRAEIGTADEAKYYLDMGVRHFCIGTDIAILHNWWKEQGEALWKAVEGA
jgi:acyl-CoA synthetase (AMP-forming)/AMP-acid ligase II